MPRAFPRFEPAIRVATVSPCLCSRGARASHWRPHPALLTDGPTDRPIPYRPLPCSTTGTPATRQGCLQAVAGPKLVQHVLRQGPAVGRQVFAVNDACRRFAGVHDDPDALEGPSVTAHRDNVRRVLVRIGRDPTPPLYQLMGAAAAGSGTRPGPGGPTGGRSPARGAAGHRERVQQP